MPKLRLRGIPVDHDNGVFVTDVDPDLLENGVDVLENIDADTLEAPDTLSPLGTCLKFSGLLYSLPSILSTATQS